MAQFGRFTHRFPRWQLELNPSEGFESAPNSLGKIDRSRRFFGQRSAQNVSCLFLHRAVVVRRPDPQHGLRLLVKVPYSDASHGNPQIAINDCIVCNDCDPVNASNFRRVPRDDLSAGGADGPLLYRSREETYNGASPVRSPSRKTGIPFTRTWTTPSEKRFGSA